MKRRVRNKIIISGIVLIIVGVLIMLLLPGNISKDNGIVSENVEISEPTVPNQDPIIKEEGAITLVLKHLPEAEASDIQSFSQEYRDGGWLYEGSIKVPKKKIVYNFQIDADLGTILQWEAGKAGQK